MKTDQLLNSFLITILSIFLISCASTTPGERASKTKEEVDSSMVITPQKETTDKITKNQGKVDTTAKEPEVKILSNPESNEDKNVLWAVQLGAFKEIKNVENFEKIVKKDFPDLFIKTVPNEADKTYKVTAGKFPTKEEAYKLRDFCVEKGYKDAWVVKVPK
jgi:cell division septation protein DedD